MMNVEVFECDEFGEMVSFLSNTDAGRATGDFEIANDEVLAAREVDGVLSGVGSFEEDFRSFGCADDDGFFLGAALRDFEAAAIGVGSGLKNDFVAGIEGRAREDGEPFFVVRRKGDGFRFERY